MKQLFSLHSSCFLCGGTTNQQISLCQSCEDDLPVIENSCSRCGLPVAIPSKEICGHCLKNAPEIDYTESLYFYKPPIDYLITKLKFEEKLVCASIFAHLLSGLTKKIGAEDIPDVIVPVPLHLHRLSQRGFNQALEIAKPISAKSGIPLDYKYIRRIKSTTAQSKLNVTERKRNIKNSFEVQGEKQYRHVLLIDDVITTGSTINELAKTIKDSGVEKVGVWSIARAILD